MPCRVVGVQYDYMCVRELENPDRPRSKLSCSSGFTKIVHEEMLAGCGGEGPDEPIFLGMKVPNKVKTSLTKTHVRANYATCFAWPPSWFAH